MKLNVASRKTIYFYSFVIRNILLPVYVRGLKWSKSKWALKEKKNNEGYEDMYNTNTNVRTCTRVHTNKSLRYIKELQIYGLWHAYTRVFAGVYKPHPITFSTHTAFTQLKVKIRNIRLSRREVGCISKEKRTRWQWNKKSDFYLTLMTVR